MFKAGPVLSMLREKTGEIHRRLEQRMNAVDRLAAPASRDDLVRRYHQFHTAMEAAMAPALRGAGAGDWRRADLVGECLGMLGLEPLPAARIAALDRRQALGALYVLEGSSLGGRVILKDLARRGADCQGLQFLDPHGDGVGARWRAVIDLLERETAAPHRLVDGALTAFAEAHGTLCPEDRAA